MKAGWHTEHRPATEARIPRRFSPVLAAIAASVLLAGTVTACSVGSDGGLRTFEHDAYPFTFRYPGDFEFSDDVEWDGQQPPGAEAGVGIGLDERNALFLTRVPIPGRVDRATFEMLKRITDAGERTPGKESEIAGFRYVEYQRIALDSLPDGHARAIHVFDRDRAYAISCQWTDRRDEVEQACDQALATLRPAE